MARLAIFLTSWLLAGLMSLDSVTISVFVSSLAELTPEMPHIVKEVSSPPPEA